MKKIIDTFSKKTIYEAINVNTMLTATGKSWEELKVFISEYKVTEFDADIRTSKPCPECGYTMSIFSVNTRPDEVVEKYKSMWLCGSSCSKRGCLYEEYSTNTIEEETLILLNEE